MNLDFDECEANCFDCPPNSTCINEIGTYNCLWPNGTKVYIYSDPIIEKTDEDSKIWIWIGSLVVLAIVIAFFFHLCLFCCCKKSEPSTQPSNGGESVRQRKHRAGENIYVKQKDIQNMKAAIPEEQVDSQSTSSSSSEEYETIA